LIAHERYVPPFFIALISIGLGDKETALEWLEKAYEARDCYMIYLKTEPRLDLLRRESRFAKMLQRIGLAG
jgi:hypothetical protein